MDNFMVKLFQRREATPAPISAIPATTDPKALGNQTLGGGSFEENIVYARSPQTALTVSAVHRAVELRMKTEMQFQPQYQRLNVAGGNFTQDNYGYGRHINYLLQVQPNPTTTASHFFEQLTYHRLMLGNGIAWIERDEWGDILHFWLCTSASYNHATGTYQLQYESETGPRFVNNVERDDVIHLPNTFKTPDGLWGIPTLKYALDTLSLVKTEQQQALESAAKGGRVKLLIGEQTQGSVSPIAAGRFDPQEAKKYAKEINRDIYSQDVVALQNLDKVQQISMSAQEMQMVELLNMGVDDVARFWGVPRPLLMADTNSHYTTPTAATMEFLSRTIQPAIVEIEQEFMRKILTEDDFGKRKFHMCEQPLLRLDPEAQAKVDAQRLATGSYTVNEIRKQYDMPAVKDGDIVYVLTNLAELGSAKLRDVAGGGRPTEEPKNEGDDEK